MVLFNNIVEEFDLIHRDQHCAAGVDLVDLRLLLLSIATFSGAPFFATDLAKKRLAAAMSRLVVSRNSTVLP